MAWAGSTAQWQSSNAAHNNALRARSPPCSYSTMRLPAATELEPLRARFKRLPPALLDLLEACLQVRWKGGSSRASSSCAWRCKASRCQLGTQGAQ